MFKNVWKLDTGLNINTKIKVPHVHLIFNGLDICFNINLEICSPEEGWKYNMKISNNYAYSIHYSRKFTPLKRMFKYMVLGQVKKIQNVQI